MAGRFGAVVTAMVTPFRDDHSLDLEGARRLADHLFEHGSDTLVVAGSTGESPTLSHKEKLELFGAVIQAAQTWAGRSGPAQAPWLAPAARPHD